MVISLHEQPLNVAKADLFRSLGHPVRVGVLEMLVEGDQPVSRLLSETRLEPSSLSQHLAVMKRAGVVTSTRAGNAVTYRLADSSVVDFLAVARTVLVVTLGHVRSTLQELEEQQDAR